MNGNTLEDIKTLSTPDTITSLASSPDGKFIASTAKYSAIRLWNTSSYEYSILPQNSNDIKLLKFSPDSRYLISISNDNTINIWDVYTLKIYNNMKSYYDIISLDISPDGE